MDVIFLTPNRQDYLVAIDVDTSVTCTFKKFDFESTAEFTLLKDSADYEYLKYIHDLEYGENSFDFSRGVDEASSFENPEEVVKTVGPQIAAYLQEEIPWMLTDIHTYGKEIRKKIGQSIKEAREKYGLTVRQCANLCFLSKNNFHRVEMGECNYNIDTLIRIASAMEIDITL